MTENVGLPAVANASAGLGPIPDAQTEMNMPAEEKKEEKITVVGTSGEPVAKPGRKRGRPAGNGKKAQPAPTKAETRCRVSVRFRLRNGDKVFEMRTEGKAKSPQQVQALFLRWSREVETRWAKLG